MDKVRKPKTQRGKRILKARQPQAFEPERQLAAFRGSKCSQNIVQIMKDLLLIRKPHGRYFNRKKEWHPFDDQTPLERFAEKFQLSLFLFGSNAKKRPENLIMARTHEFQILDIFEFGLTDIKPMSSFKNGKIAVGTKPMLIVSGPRFEEDPTFQRLKSFFVDFFDYPKLEAIDTSKIEHVVQLVATDTVIHFRSYKIDLVNKNERKLVEIGPHFDMTLRRSRLATDDLFLSALKQPQVVKTKKIKNKSRSKLGVSLGRIHMQRQDYTRLNTRKMKGLRKNVKPKAPKKPKKKRINDDSSPQIKKKARVA